MLDDVISLLAAMGVAGAGDDPLLAFVVNSVTERVKNETNQPEIPEGLHYMAAGMAVGEYLNLKKAPANWTLKGWTWKRRLSKFKRVTPTRFLPLEKGAKPRNRG